MKRCNIIAELTNYLPLLFISIQEDAHVANGKFMGDQNKALFGVFDGHGGREVAVYCNEEYEKILDENKKLIEETGGEQEWLR